MKIPGNRNQECALAHRLVGLHGSRVTTVPFHSSFVKVRLMFEFDPVGNR